MHNLNVQVKVLDSKCVPPKSATEFSAGYDLIANIKEPIEIFPTTKATLIPTGLALFIGNPNVAGIILPRSGLGHKKGLVLGNTLGLIDADYQNEWFVSAWNRGQEPSIVIDPGERIAQVIFIPIIHPEFVAVDHFSEVTDRGMGGFGSTGKFKTE